MSQYSEFFLNSSSSVIQLECLEISHPDFTKTYRIVRNATKGITVKYEDGNLYPHEYYPLSIVSMGNRGDLDQGFRITLGDLGDVLPAELDSVTSADGFDTKPTVSYRSFRSDDLETVLFGPLFLEVTTFSFTREGSSFEAKAPSLNINRTGEIYTLDRFPGLRGFL
jgi:hypothetical protein